MSVELGYKFYSPKGPAALGHPRLDVNIYAQPTGEHFDPQRASFQVAEPGDGVDELKVTHPWHGQRRLRLCAGSIVIQDRHRKTVEGYSFGGDLEIVDHGSYSTCTVTSPAPIFDLSNPRSTETEIVAEFEAMLARRRARWGKDDRGFERRLATAEPFLLFAAALEEMEARLCEVPVANRDDPWWQVCGPLPLAIRALKQSHEWPRQLPTLDQLL